MQIDYSLVGFHIQTARRSKKITQAELAERIDMSVSYISCIERAKKRISLETMVRIADALDTSVDYFLFGNLKAQKSGPADNWAKLLSECTPQQEQIIYTMAILLKETLRMNPALF